MDLYLSGKTARVTGASAQLEALQKLAREVKAQGYIEPVAIAVDLHDAERRNGFAQEATRQLGRIMSEQIVAHDPTEEARRAFAQGEIPGGRFGYPEELADERECEKSGRSGALSCVLPRAVRPAGAWEPGRR